MTFAQTWLRQSLGAAGVSLLVPLAILGAAGVLAAGGGLGGLSDLGQIASGPTLPGNELTEGGPAIADADIVGADLGAPAGTPAGGGTAGAPGPFSGSPGGTSSLPSPLLDVPSTPGGGENVNGGPVTGPGQPPAAPAPAIGPVQEPLGPTRQVPTVVPEPIQPVTQNLIDLLLGQPQP